MVETDLDEAEWVRKMVDQLNLIDEKRMKALCHGQLYQQRMARAFNKKVQPRNFKEGDLVLRKMLPNVQDPRGKFTPNYEGPYVVKRVLMGGALNLSHMDGLDLKDSVNSDTVKMYYA